MSRSSAARWSTVVALEDIEKLFRGVDDRVRLFALELLTIVDAAPRHGDRVHGGRFRRADVERRVADVRALVRIDTHAFRGEQERLGMRLVTLRLVAADNNLEEVAERNRSERELDCDTSLRRDDPQPPPLVLQLHEDVVDALAADQRVVQRLVVSAVDGDE